MTALIHRLALPVFLTLICLAAGAASVWVGQDINGDQLMYHLYTPHLLLDDRFELDIAAGGLGTFTNPLPFLPFFLAAHALPASVVGFLIGAFQGLNLVAVFLIAMQLVDRRETSARFAFAFGAVILAAWLPMNILELGRSFADNWGSVPFLFGALLVIRQLKRADLGVVLLLIGGALVGFSGGLKNTNLVPCIAFGFAYLVTSRAIKPTTILGLSMIAGFALSNGYWLMLMQSHYDSPMFPYYNALFKSPLYDIVNWRDARWQAQGISDLLLAPYHLFVDGKRFVEGGMSDGRWLTFLVVLAITAVVTLANRLRRPLSIAASTEPANNHRPLVFAVIFVLTGFVLWVSMFYYARYLLIVDYVMQAILVALLAALPLPRDARAMIAGIAVGALVVSSQTLPMDWARLQKWGKSWYEIENPDLPPGSVVLLGNGIGSFASFLPTSVRVVGIGSNYFFTGGDSKPMLKRVQDAINDSQGKIMHLEMRGLPRPVPYADLDKIYGHFGLKFGDCRVLKGNISDFDICELSRIAPNWEAPVSLYGRLPGAKR
ncbi:DUF2029 domain-containing protein [Azospirillum cavernae]|uniref:DUF2029 domain-containing protein n=1 Tax=Azospirillum cavernae TaxID=2320860 RepID=A0A418VWI7_9PROT|nr:glycosyltransferase 87 family protein [Azospirillum cavernae]RJF81500.1 DUF2029 domain-containing protein [Azospirillum cavernae]